MFLIESGSRLEAFKFAKKTLDYEMLCYNQSIEFFNNSHNLPTRTRYARVVSAFNYMIKCENRLNNTRSEV